MNPETAFSWMLVGIAIIILSVPTTLAQRMGIAWLFILGGFFFIIATDDFIRTSAIMRIEVNSED